jgi:hypothetical protein
MRLLLKLAQIQLDYWSDMAHLAWLKVKLDREARRLDKIGSSLVR